MARVLDDTARMLVTRPTGRDAWDSLLAGIPTADPLQSWAWSEAGLATGEHWMRLIAVDVDGRPAAAIQWQLVSSVLGHPLAYAPHGPIWRRGDAEAGAGALRALMTAMRTDADRAGASAILVDPRRGSPAAVGADPSEALAGLGFEATSRHVQMPSTRVVDLRGGIDSARAAWDKDTRNLARRAAREGVEVECVGADDIPTVGALHALMEAVGSRGSFAPRTAAFLAAYGQEADDRAFICLGRWQERVIAGALVGFVGDRAYYQFAGSLRAPELRHVHAAYGVMDRIIGACVARGALSLDLCGVNEKDDPTADPRWEGLSSFKRGFGGLSVRHPPVATVVLRPGIERLRAAGQWARARAARMRGVAV
jgi:uncharacterized protein (DUF2237 family)